MDGSSQAPTIQPEPSVRPSGRPVVQIYPAIDIQHGRLARAQGAAATADPIALAKAWLAQGASWLHVVDLDRAYGTGRDNDAWVRAICALAGGRVQLGGQLRDATQVADALRLGAARAVVASATAADAAALARITAAVPPGKLAVNVDLRAGRLAVRGSEAAPDLTPQQLVRQAVDHGIRVAVCRDLDRDGALQGANLASAAALLGQGAAIVVAGGVGSAADLRTAREAGMDGAIVGRALYEGRLTLEEALACSR
jgi:phosphoribosylformimino-5-aminoimidazole carboxamide ribotide isomerase